MAISWENNGSYADLSPLAKDSIWVTSQAAGNRTASSAEAMTAPGSQPVDPLQEEAIRDPHLPLGGEMPSATSGKPQASEHASYTPNPVRWGKTTTPRVVRSEPVNGPTADLAGPQTARTAPGNRDR